MKNRGAALKANPKQTTEATHLKLLEQVIEDTTPQVRPCSGFWKRLFSIFKISNDLSLDDWQRLEQKAQRKSDSRREPFSGRGW